MDNNNDARRVFKTVYGEDRKMQEIETLKKKMDELKKQIEADRLEVENKLLVFEIEMQALELKKMLEERGLE